MSTPTAPVPAIEYPEARWLQPVLINAASYMAFSAELAARLTELEARYPQRTAGSDLPRSSADGR